MKRLLWTITGLGVGLTLWTHSAAAQVFGSPFYAVPTGSPGVTVSGRYGRGLNDESGEFNYLGLRIDVSGQDVSFWANGGPVWDGGDTDFTLGGGFAVNLPLAPAAPVHLTIQGGVGWLEDGGITLLNIPIGVALIGNLPSSSAVDVTPWVMPRLHILRASGFGTSNSETGIGISAGVGFTFPSGFGLDAALDWQDVEGFNPIHFGIGFRYKPPLPSPRP